MDERIRNLMAERGTPELALEVDDPELATKVHGALLTLWNDAPRVAASIDACVLENLERMGQMGMDLVDFVRAHHPEFPFAEGLGKGGDPFAHLPSLPQRLRAMVAERDQASARDAAAARTPRATGQPAHSGPRSVA
jgi:hypothetical protein